MNGRHAIEPLQLGFTCIFRVPPLICITSSLQYENLAI